MTSFETTPQAGKVSNRMDNISTILFPTDFSETAHNAFEYALHLAEEFEAKIVLLHIYQMAPVDARFVPESFTKALEEKKIEAALKSFHEYQLEAQLKLNKSVEVTTELISGFADKEIIRLSESGDYDLIVMGTLGAASDTYKSFGSVTANVIRNAACPVLAVPSEATYKPLEHVMYAISFEEQDFAIIDQLLEWVSSLGAKLSCTHIRRSNQGWDRIDLSLFERLYQLEEADQALEFYISNHEDILQGLQQYITANKVDLVAMLTHKRFILDAMYNESLTKKMTLYTDVPILVFHDR